MEIAISGKEKSKQSGFFAFEDRLVKSLERNSDRSEFYYPSGQVPKHNLLDFSVWNKLIVGLPANVHPSFLSTGTMIVAFILQDINPDNLESSISTLHEMVSSDNDVFIVTRPYWKCVKKICSEFSDHQFQIVFKFKIGSADNEVLKFWEPGTPLFKERLRSLEFAHRNGFRTSVCCDPMLDNAIHKVIEAVEPFVTNSIWLGKMNLPGASSHCRNRGLSSQERIATIKEIEKWQGIENLYLMVKRYEDHPMVLWEDPIMEMVEGL